MNATKISPAELAATFHARCKASGWNYALRAHVVTIEKHFAPGDNDAYIGCDMEAYDILAIDCVVSDLYLKGKKMLRRMVAEKRGQWASEAELNFARRGKAGEKMHRELWANGHVMVGHEGALANQCVPLERAIEIWRNGWKINVS